MPQRSAGILLYRRRHGGVEVLLVHPGGPFWANKDDGAWSIPKGALRAGRGAARRGPARVRGGDGWSARRARRWRSASFRQSAAKTVDAWAVEGDFDPAGADEQHLCHGMAAAVGPHGRSPRGRSRAWFTPAEAARKILKGQRPILEALLRYCWEDDGPRGGESGG